jgi:RNA polymerase sigma factor (sigma-70 family)
MPAGRLDHVLAQVRRAALQGERAAASDAQLLDRFVSRGDPAALEALVRRHVGMAWGVCRRILSNHHDAEDALQATFLVLVRRAASIVPRDMVASWLYGVAHRTALKARAIAARRSVREAQVPTMPEPAMAPPEPSSDLWTVLDQELSGLPDKYRVPVVLCDLEGKTRKQAARQLGWPEGTVAGRLARARRLLAEALARRGIALSVGALAAALADPVTAAPIALVESTIQAANRVAAGVTAGAISARVAILTEGVLRTMVLTKQKTLLTILLVFLLGLGSTIAGWPGAAAENRAEAQSAGAAAQPGPAGGDNLKNTLLALDKHLRETAGRGDWKEIAKFYAPEYLGVSALATSRHAANVEAVKTHRPTDWKIRDIDFVRVSHDAAVLTYVYDCKVLSPDGRLLQTRRNHRVTLVWAQRNGGWVLTYCHDEHGQPGNAATRLYTNEVRDVILNLNELTKKKKADPQPDK